MNDRMCGMCGVFERAHGPVERATVVRMADSIRHHGPDGDGYHFELGVCFGHRGLSIIDRESGRQPICNEGGGTTLDRSRELAHA